MPAPDVLHLGDNDVLRGAYNHDPLPKEYQDAFRLPLLFSKIATPDIPRQGPWAVARVVDGVELQPYQLTAADRRQLREKVGPNSPPPNYYATSPDFILPSCFYKRDENESYSFSGRFL